MIDAVLFDLDDTIYDQHQWLAGAWDAVARAAHEVGVDGPALRRALGSVAAEGSARGGIIDRALARVGAAVDVAPLVEAFKAHRPPSLDPYPGAIAALRRIRRDVRTGLVTDGDIAVQRSKIDALGLADLFDVVVLSDEFGRQRRKPDPAPFLSALASLGVDPVRAVYVGDHPEKDVVGSQAIGMRAIRVRTGEYATAPDITPPWATAADVAAAVALVTEAMTPSPV